MTTAEIILAGIQLIVVPFLAWLSLSVIDTAKRVSAVEAKQEIFWDLVGAKAVKVLHSPHCPELDRLLDMWIDQGRGGPQMSHSELHEFVHRLEMAEAEPGDHFRSYMASMLKAIVLAKHCELHQQMRA